MSNREGTGAARNTDRELFREQAPQGLEHHADSLHVTVSGGIGINCGGTVYVRPLHEWHRAMAIADRMKAEDQTAFEAAAYAFIREVIVRGGRPGLLEKFEAGGMAEVRKYLAKNPEMVREVRAATSAYAAAIQGAPT